MKRQNLNYCLAFSVAVIAFVVYLSSLRNEFVEWDDPRYVLNNPHIRSFDPAFFKWAFFDFYAANWHPLTWISHALDYAVWGLNPLGHHLTNNILHAVNTFLVVLLVVRFIETGFGDSCSSGKSGTLPNDHRKRPYFPPVTSSPSRFTLIAAGITGLLFGLHPIHVESVAWVAERKDLLCALFYLLSVMAYMRYAVTTLFSQETKFDHRGTETQRDSNIQIRNRLFSVTPCLCGSFSLHRYYLLSLLFFILALLSKPMAVSLPLVLLILDWYPFERITSFRTFRSALTGKLPFVVLSVISSMVTIMAQKAVAAMQLMESVPLSTRVTVAAGSLLAYLRNMAFPLHLVPYYPYPNDVSFGSPRYLLAVLLVSGIMVLCIAAARKRKVWLAVWGYYVITLIPVLGIVQVGGQAMADRYTYLPGLGPFLLIGLAGAWVATKAHTAEKHAKILDLAIASIAVLASVSLAWSTVHQIGIWKNSIALWSYVIERQPQGVSMAYNNRGKVLIDMGRLDEAIADFDRAVAMNPFFHKAYYNRGFVFDKMGRFDEAIADFDKAIASNPSFREAYYNRGLTYNKTGLFGKAIESFTKSLEIDPNDVDAYVSRGISYALVGRNDRAFEDFDKAVRLDQNHGPAYFSRGKLSLNQGNRELAMLDFQKACDLGYKDGCYALEAPRSTHK